MILFMGLGIVAFGLIIGGKGGLILPGMKADDTKSVSDDASFRRQGAGEPVADGPAERLRDLPVPDDVPPKSVAAFQNGQGLGVLYTSSKPPKDLLAFYRTKLGSIGWHELSPVDVKDARIEGANLTWGPAGSKESVPVLPRKKTDSRELPDPGVDEGAQGDEAMHVFAGPGQVLYVTVSTSKEGTNCSLLMVQR